VSSDRGRTFRASTLPSSDSITTLGDGVVALGTKGLIYYATLMFVNGVSAVGVARSVEGTFGFSEPVDVSGKVENKFDFQDKESLAVDRSPTSPFQGNVYVAWTDFSHTTSIEFARSVDLGKTFQKPITLSIKTNSTSVQGSNIAVGPDGEVYVAFLETEIGDSGSTVIGIGFVKSLDGGLTWTNPTRLIASPLFISAMPGMDNVRTNSFPRVAVGRDGVIHIVYGAQPLWYGPDRSDVFYIRSKDGGDTFSAPLRLNDDNTTHPQFFPSVAVTDSGAVGVGWWDMRNSPAFGSLTDIYMTISHDGGGSFGPNFRVTNHNFVFTPIDKDLASAYHGDYDWMTADGEDFFLPSSDEFFGEPDVFCARVPATRDPLAPDFVVSSAKLYDSVVAGNQTDYPISSSAAGGFSAQLSFSVSPQVPGIDMSFDQSAAGVGAPVNLHIAASPAAPPGSYLFAVSAAGGGKTRASSFWLTILSPSAPYVSPPANITRTPGYTFLAAPPRVDSGGSIHLAFYDDTDGVSKVYYTRSDDRGRTYPTRVLLSRDGESSTRPDIKLDSHGNIFVAWQYQKNDFQNGRFIFHRHNVAIAESLDGGRTFSSPVDVVAADLTLPVLGSLDVFDDGGIVITYTAAAVGGQRLYAVRSDDSGRSFGPPFQVSVAGQNPNFPTAASDGKNTIFAIYGAFNPTALRMPVFAAKSVDGGRTFSTPVLVSSPDAAVLQFPPIIAMGSNGIPYVVYHSYTVEPAKTPGFVIISGPSIYLASAPDGANFTPPTLLAAGAYAPRMVLDRSDNIYISYLVVAAASATQTYQQILVTRSCDKGASFSIPVMASNATSFAETASVMQLDRNGNLNLAWGDNQFEASPQTVLATSADGGVTFGTVVNVSSSPGEAIFALINTLPDGSIVAVYHDDSAQNRDLFSATLQAPAIAPPDFALLDQELTVSRGATGKLVVSISRPGGFDGNVTVTAPSGLPRGVSLSQSQVTTATTNATFDLAVAKKHVRPGTLDLMFTATDDAGRQRSGTISLTVQ
jgi:hypothetical protein